MDWKAEERQRKTAIAEERNRLLAMSDAEALRLSHEQQYQRMRYQRERYANDWLNEVKRSLPAPKAKASKKAEEPKKSWMDD